MSLVHMTQETASYICAPADQAERFKAARSRLFPIAKVRKPTTEIPRVQLSTSETRIGYLSISTHAMLWSSQRKPFTTKEFMRLICKTVSKRQGISVEDILSPRRNDDVVAARHLAVYLATKHTKWSLPMIGEFFGGRDHTTILYARDKIAAARTTDLKIDSILTSLEREILDQRPPLWS